MTDQSRRSPEFSNQAISLIGKIIPLPRLSDPRQQRDAEIIIILSAMILVAAVITAGAAPVIFTNPLRGLILTGSVGLIMVLVQILARRGNLLLASRLFVYSIWILDTVIIALSGGFHSIFLPSYIAITVMGGLILGRKYAVRLAGLNILAFLALYFLEARDLLIEQLIHFTPLAAIFIFTINLLMAASVLILVLEKYAAAFDQLAQKETTLSETNLVLKKAIAAREEAEVALRLSEKRLKSALMDSPYPTMLIASDGEILEVNTAWQDKTGYSAEEISGLDQWAVHFFRDQAPRVNSIIDRVLNQDQERGEGFYNIFTRQGMPKKWYFRWVLLPALPDGRKLVLSIAIDQTNLSEVESALRKSEENISLFSLITNDGLWDWDLKTDNVIFDPRYYTMAGYQVNEFPHRLEEFRKRVHPQDVERVFLQAADHLAGAIDRFAVEFRFLMKDGGWLWVLGRGKIVEQDENGNPLRFVGTHTDISDRKKAEEELNQHQGQLEAIVEDRTQKLEERIAESEKLNAALSNILDDYQTANEKLTRVSKDLADTYQELESLTYTISNDLRDPLGEMKGVAEKLSRKYRSKLGPQGMQSLEQIEQNAVRVGRLVDDLLQLAELGKRALSRTEIDPNPLIEDVLKTFSYQIQDRKITVNLKDLPHCQADQDLLKIVFHHLISNAVKFTSMAPKPEITIGFKPGQSSRRVIYFVKDNGVGFSMKDHEKVFETFQRLHDQDIFRGTGIGLALAKRIITRHGGEIWAEARQNKGASFYFDLPSLEH